MIYRKILFLIAFLIGSIYLAACCSCGKAASKENTIQGYITVVGNEPFTKLAIMGDDGKTYILKCSKELEKELWKKQGNFYLIQYGDSREEEGNTVYIVEKVVPIIKEK